MEPEAKDEIVAPVAAHIIEHLGRKLPEKTKVADVVEIMGMVFATIVIYWWQERRSGQDR